MENQEIFGLVAKVDYSSAGENPKQSHGCGVCNCGELTTIQIAVNGEEVCVADRTQVAESLTGGEGRVAELWECPRV